MKQNKIIKILTAVLIVLLIAIVAVGVWSNQKRESREDKSNESQPVTEEVSTEEQTKELPKVENDPQQVTEESPLYLALSRFALETDVKADETLSFMVEAAEEGNADAQYFAGEMFLQGIGTKPDIEKAAKYLKQAYDNGNEHAFAIYGKLCFMGDGLRQSYEQAYEAFYNLSKPTPEVICAMGIMNIYGMGVRPDYEQARNYLSTAESAGDIIATTAKQSIKNATYKRRPSEIEIEIRQKTVNIVDYSTQESELIELVDTAYKKIALQENYDKFIQELEKMSKMSPELVNKVAIFGSDNWLFFQNNADGTSYRDYVGDNAFSEKELASIKKNLEAQKQKAEEKGVKLLLPVDNLIADDFSNDANTQIVATGEIPDGWEGLDIGPETAKIYADAVKDAKTVVWNGPMGCFEMPNFAKGTEIVAKALAETDAVTIIGGGDSAAAVNQLGFGDKMTHISTGGGASLEFLEGKELPGVAAANDK